jgi:hypothetical protein
MVKLKDDEAQTAAARSRSEFATLARLCLLKHINSAKHLANRFLNWEQVKVLPQPPFEESLCHLEEAEYMTRQI